MQSICAPCYASNRPVLCQVHNYEDNLLPLPPGSEGLVSSRGLEPNLVSGKRMPMGPIAFTHGIHDETAQSTSQGGLELPGFRPEPEGPQAASRSKVALRWRADAGRRIGTCRH